jgi:predicted deacylase
MDPQPGGMNRVWPGTPDGSLTERMAHRIWTELVARADAVVDLHTGGRHCPVWVFYEAHGVSPHASEETNRRAEEMARLFGAPVLYLETEPYGGRKTLRAHCVDHGVPAIVPELGAEGTFDETIAELACQGLRNIMKGLSILDGAPELPRRQVQLRWSADYRRFGVRANCSGVFVSRVRVGDVVRKGDAVGFIYSPRTFETLEVLAAPQDGYVFTVRENPVAHQGDVLVTMPEILRWFES